MESQAKGRRQSLPGLSAQVLRWARETAGLSLRTVAAELNKQEVEIEGWENGAECPTYAQLEVLAYKLYKRPLAAFFLPTPPEETPLDKEFRTLPRSEITRLEPDTLRAIREIQAKQLYLNELTDGKNPASKPIFREPRLRRGLEVNALSRHVREYLGLSLSDQLAFANSAQAFQRWRSAVERHGIFVFKRPFEQRDISGFCILDDEFPVICINNSTTHNRQTFTLFHELCHVLFHTSGICKIDDSYISSLRGEKRQVEVTCNYFAGSFLVPEFDLLKRIDGFQITDAVITALANTYKVSRSVIVRRLYDLKRVPKSFFEEKESLYMSEYFRYRADGTSSGSYYPMQVAYLGRNYIALVMRAFRNKRFPREQLADYFGIRAKNLEGLEQAAAAIPGRA